MRIAFLTSLLLVGWLECSAHGMHSSAVSPLGTGVYFSSKKSQTRFDIKSRDGKSWHVEVARDATVAPMRDPKRVEIVADIVGVAVVLRDVYPSARAGMSYCQAGEESFLRIISIDQEIARVTLSIKLASCLENIELADQGIEWDPAKMTLMVNWLSGPGSGHESERRVIKISPAGVPE